jgi:hypothetical protein
MEEEAIRRSGKEAGGDERNWKNVAFVRNGIGGGVVAL